MTTDLPEHRLAEGDIGTVVLVHEGGKGCTVEFMTLTGDTVAVVTLLASQVRQTSRMTSLTLDPWWSRKPAPRRFFLD